MNMVDSARTQYLETPSETRLAYTHTPGRSPTVVFLSGYASDMSGSKALYFESVFTKLGFGFLRLDYSGHGQSDGDFVDGSIGQWSDDARRIVEHVTTGPLVLVGSSMGGWTMLLVARALAQRVCGLVGIAAAPDFTEELMWHSLSGTERDELESTGEIYRDSDYVDDPYPITLKLIEDGRKHLQLVAPIPLSCPTRLIHGLEDRDVPWQTSMKLAEQLEAKDVQITLVKGGGHRLSNAEQLTLIAGQIEKLIDEVGS